MRHEVYQPEGHIHKLGRFACYDPAKVSLLGGGRGGGHHDSGSSAVGFAVTSHWRAGRLLISR